MGTCTATPGLMSIFLTLNKFQNDLGWPQRLSQTARSDLAAYFGTVLLHVIV